MSSPSPSDEREGLPWIIQPGTYEWIDGIFNTPLKQWAVIFACVILCICCIFIIILLVSSSGNSEQTFSSYMKDAMRKKLMNLTM